MASETGSESFYSEEKLSELNILKQSIEEQKKIYLTQILRLQADFENYRKRTEREKGELIKYGRNLLIAEMIDVYETVQLARKMILDAENNSPVLDDLEQIENKVSEILKQSNVTAISSLGEKFNTLYHEVVGAIEKEGVEDGTILEEVRPGYKIDDRVLRTAMVKIAKSEVSNDFRATGVLVMTNHINDDSIRIEINNDEYIGKTCPYCMTVIKPNVEVLVCPACEVPHHKECWEDNGNKCTTYGCKGIVNGNRQIDDAPSPDEWMTSQQDDDDSESESSQSAAIQNYHEVNNREHSKDPFVEFVKVAKMQLRFIFVLIGAAVGVILGGIASLIFGFVGPPPATVISPGLPLLGGILCGLWVFLNTKWLK